MSGTPHDGRARGLPRDGLGLGLRPAFHRDLDQLDGSVGFFEVLGDNYLGASDVPRRQLARVGSRYPLAVHCVGMNLVGTEPLDHDYLRAVRDLAESIGATCVTDHLCWSASARQRHHDLLPVPCRSDLIPYAASRIREARDLLGLPFGIENVSTYLGFVDDDLPEWEFVRRVAEEADCGLLVDINNVFVSSCNHGFEPREYLEALPWERVLYAHVSGHQLRPDGLRHDTHDRGLAPEVLALHAEARRLAGPLPTVLEWDEAVPPLHVATAELARLRGASI
jgi:uncharacterized protein (UPF0276 family)